MQSETEGCPHRPPCDGCPRWGEQGLGGALTTRLEQLAERAHTQLTPLVEGDAMGYRLRARLAVRGTSDLPKVGLFQAHSHNIVDIPRCGIHHPVVNEVVAVFKASMRETRTPPYHDVHHSGLLRYLQVVIERSSQQAQLVLVCNSDSPEPVERLVQALRRRLAPSLHSLWFNGNTRKSNTILGETWCHVSGPAAIEERVGGARVFYPPDAFGQANLELFERAVERMHAFVPDGARVVEYHAGVGAIGLGLVERVASLDCVEIAPGGLRGLELGAAALPTDQRASLAIHRGGAGAHTHLLERADCVIVDPPRKGLEASLLEGLVATPSQRLAYLSCGLDSFERDVDALMKSGSWRPVLLEPFAFFPFTQHVEMLGLFERCGAIRRPRP